VNGMKFMKKLESDCKDISGELKEPSPHWHERVLQERLSKVKSGKATFISLDDLKRRLGKSPKSAT